MKITTLRNDTVAICHDTSRIGSNGVYFKTNPLLYSVPLLLTQLSLISITSTAFDICLKPLGQSTLVSQILGGLVLGPSVLGRAPYVSTILFPQRGTLVLETLATFGLTLFMFIISVKMDPILMFKPDRTAFAIGISLYVFTMLLPLIICFIVLGHLDFDPSLQKSLPVMVSSQSLVAFPGIACLLAELKIVNTEVGRLAVATTLFYNILAISTTAFGVAFVGAREHGIVKGICSIMSSIGMVLGIAFIIRPLMVRFLLSEKPINSSPPPSSSTLSQRNYSSHSTELQLTSLFVLLFICALISETIGQHYFLGPAILGLGLPDESPLGVAVVKKLDTFVSSLLYPTFLTISGLKTNIFTIRLQESLIAIAIVVSGVVAKFGAVIIPALHRNVPLQDAFVLGLVLNTRGINELILYNIVLADKQLSDQEFALMVISVILVTALITPLIKFFYDPSRQYIPMRRMTIQHSKKDTEMTIVVCIHQQDNVPSMINLVEASFSSIEDPISIIVIILVEVVGHSAPMLLAYKPHRNLESSSSRNNHIVNAFQQYERQNEGNTTVQVFTNMSRFDAMHDDICRVAVKKRANLLILPFHKQWAIDGMIGSVYRSVQAMNQKVIECAPCSIGILIDRGPINGSLCIFNGRSAYHVAVLFIGGVDDVESLAYGARMARHEGVIVTVIRFLLFGHDNSRERKHDTAIIEEYRCANAGNERFLYSEVLVKDGVELADTLTGMENRYDLILVGRNHQNSPLLFGLHAWSECPELGVIGDLLASPDIGITSSVLVIQQQKMVGKVNTSVGLLQSDKNVFMHAEEPSTAKISGSHSSVTLTVDRDDDRSGIIRMS